MLVLRYLLLNKDKYTALSIFDRLYPGYLFIDDITYLNKQLPDLKSRIPREISQCKCFISMCCIYDDDNTISSFFFYKISRQFD